jgi:anti-anti-sigma factor
VRHLTDEMVIERGSEGTTVRFHLPAQGGRDGEVEPAADEARLDDPTGPVLELHGELDLATVDGVRADLFARLAALPEGGSLLVDLRAATYLPSAGIGLLLEARERARARGVDLQLLTEPSGLAARALALAGLPAT